MRIPRDISGQYLAQKMSVFGYRVTRQKGSHIRLSTQQKGEHHITIPAHKNLRVGTISTILSGLSDYFGLSKEEILTRLQL